MLQISQRSLSSAPAAEQKTVSPVYPSTTNCHVHGRLIDSQCDDRHARRARALYSLLKLKTQRFFIHPHAFRPQVTAGGFRAGTDITAC